MPWYMPLQVLLIILGVFAAMELVYEALNFPFRRVVERWQERWRRLREPPQFLRKSWRSGECAALRERLAEGRRHGAPRSW